MRQQLLKSLAFAGAAFFVSTGRADVPAPPVNQSIGMPDVVLGDLTEADCRVCHDSGVPDRHHVLYGQTIPGGSVIPYVDTNGDGIVDFVYSCMSCHGTEFEVVRDCTQCHTTSPHHSTPDAQAANCVACHGDIVDNIDDGHYIPTYAPSLVTPQIGDDGEGEPANSRGTLAGGCEYCHDDDGLSPEVIRSNRTLHHNVRNAGDFPCSWCHFNDDPDEGTAGQQMRACEGCHGPDSLHNIQADSPAPANLGTLVVGGELAGYGHVGRDAGPGDSDCWGCHGFAMAGDVLAGPIIPSIGAADTKSAKAGIDTSVLVGGSGFTNRLGQLLFESEVLLTSASGSTFTLKPDTISNDALGITIPATTGPGNYDIQAVKARFASNPTVITIVPEVRIAAASADGTTVTIDGSGFAGHAAGSGTSVRAAASDVEGTILSWTDTTIVAEFVSVPDRIAVASVFGSDSAEVARVPTTPTFLRGDSNADGIVDIADAVHTLDYLFLGGRTPTCLDASDSDDNARIEITDAVATLGWLFLGFGELPYPGTEICGPDSTEDELADCEYDPGNC